MLSGEVCMAPRPVLMVALLVGSTLARAAEDPFLIPPELARYAIQVTGNQISTQTKLAALLAAIFRPVESGGLGITYDNDKTRSVAEVWRDRKANCLSMTAFYVAAARSVSIEAKYAEALNTNRWRKVGNMVRFERHVVSLVRSMPKDDLIADFIPTLRRRNGIYLVAVLPELRFRSLYHSNRAVELLAEGNAEAARGAAQLSLNVDPKCSIGWNIMGVVQAACGEPIRAEQSYRQALVLDPRDSAAIGNMESLLRESGRLAEAAKYRAQGEDVRKNDPYFNSYIAEEALAEGNLDEAQKRIQVALKLLPHEPEFHLFLARLKLTQGDPDEARKAILEAKRWAGPGERERYDGKLALIQGQIKAEK
jgi:Flp pilus assembly protein TadD